MAQDSQSSTKLLKPFAGCARCAGGDLGGGLRQSLPMPGSESGLVNEAPSQLALATASKDGILKQYKWDDGTTLVVQFMYPNQARSKEYQTYHKRIEQMVRDVAPVWETCTNIKFRFVDAQSTERTHLRLNFWTDDEVPKDWTNRASYFGQWSYLGQDCEGANPTMNLDFVDLLKECDDANTSKDRKEYDMKYMRATILHEFGHSLGFIHEQLRGDRDGAFELDVDKIIKRNQEEWGWSPEKTKNAINDLYKMDYLKASTFDLKSIMIYSFSKDQVKQVAGKAEKVDETFELSTIDRQWASIVYPPKKK